MINSKRKKILFLLGSYFEQNQGGAELQAYSLAELTRNTGWETHYCFISNGAVCDNYLKIILHPLSCKFFYRKFGNIKYPYAFRVLNLFNKIQPDIIYQRCGHSFTGIAAHYTNNHNCRLVFHIAHDKDVQICSGLWKKPYLIPEYKLMLYGLNKADIIIAQSQFQADQLMQNHGLGAVVIPNGHPIPKNTPSKTNIIKVLWIANFKPIKQPEIFVKLAEIIGKLSNVRCIMLGRTTDRYESLIRMAKNNNIEVMGELPNDKVNDLLTQSHILANTSQSEGFSNTFIQAWMRKVPVVSLQVDPDHIIEREGIGFCCTGNFEKLVGNTKRLIKDHELREQMGRKAREYAVQHHSLKNMELIIKVFDKLLPRTYAK